MKRAFKTSDKATYQLSNCLNKIKLNAKLKAIKTLLYYNARLSKRDHQTMQDNHFSKNSKKIMLFSKNKVLFNKNKMFKSQKKVFHHLIQNSIPILMKTKK